MRESCQLMLSIVTAESPKVRRLVAAAAAAADAAAQRRAREMLLLQMRESV